MFTKGEWKVITNGNALLAIAKVDKDDVNNNRNICSFEPLFLRGKRTNLYRQLGTEDEANANLMAQSPELYEELKEADRVICWLCKRLNPQHENCTSCADREVRLQILAKAEGNE